MSLSPASFSKPKRYFVYSLLLVIVGCGSTGRYSMRHDTGPTRAPKAHELNDAVPRFEPSVKRGNAKYQVFGKNYQPMPSAKGFSERGKASWYGRKFHGHLTSNGETYNMFGMSAAHKTLPIPCYVRVTNLANNKQVIVRVNDRGPFHGNRILDLSYSAATKLDMLKTGTANIQLDVIHVEKNGRWTLPDNAILPPREMLAKQAETPREKRNLFIQVAALSNLNRIDEMAKGFAVLYQVPTKTAKAGAIYKLHLGPLDDAEHAADLLQTLRQNGYQQAFSFTQ